MSIQGQIDYVSNIAAGAMADAQAISALVASLGTFQGMGAGAFDAAAAGAEKMALALQRAADASDLAAQKSQAASDLLAQKGAQDQALAAQEIAAAAASDQLAAAMQREGLAARDAAQQNAALAKLVLEQAKSAGEIAAIEAKGEQDRLTAAQAASDKLIQIKTQEAAKVAEVAKKEAADSSQSWGGESSNDGSFAGMLSALGTDAAEFGGAVGAVADVIIQAVAALVNVTAGLLEAGSQMAIDAGAFRETTEGTFAAMLHSEGQANDLYGKLLTLAARTGQSKQALETKVAKELGAGATEKQALAAIEASATIAEAVSTQAGNKLAMLLSKVEAGDKFDSRTVSGLKAVGVNVNAVYDQLAQTLGKTRKEVELLVKQGKVTADEGSAAIEAVVAKTFGKAAQAAESTIPRLVDRIKAEFANLFDSVNVEPIRKVLESVVGMIEGPQGAKLKGAFTSLFGNLFDALFGGFDSKQGSAIFDTIIGGVERFAGFIHEITPGVQGFIHGVVAGFSQWLGPMGGIASAFLKIVGVVGGSGDIWETVGRGIGFMAGFLVTLAEAILFVVGIVLGFAAIASAAFFGLLGLWSELLSGIYDFFSGLGDMITGAGDTLSADAGNAGTSIMTGLVGGITSKAGAVAEAVIRACSNAILAAEKILGISSPSKVFGKIGGYASEGMAVGIDSGADDVVQSARMMAKNAADGAAAMGSLAGPTVGVGKGAAGGHGAHGGASAGHGAHAGGGPRVWVEHLEIRASTEAGGRAAAKGFHEYLVEIGEAT